MEHFMEDALQQARIANDLKEVPVGCVFVHSTLDEGAGNKKDEIIARGCNLVNETKNATRHVEFICIDQALDYARRKRITPPEAIFSSVTVVVTVEPCIMCAAALIELGVKEIIYGCRNDRFGGCTVLDVAHLLRSTIPIRGGVRGVEAMELLKEFYKGENPSAPVPKPRAKKL
ncbi:tRNA-specific adenosine deaminase 2 [Anopheles funestus]|uniref:tRNA-specific adenosine deaminase 2 n=1 Tax=Anopheles funestus TaxID=62324 RepID=UPI0020C6983C|nr:tRNA-specific adenosine deaminase 2 [Anopheles funestus]